MIEWVNGFRKPEQRIRAAKPAYSNILLIAATNRADNLDPALLRPGRFDRRLYFDLPTKTGRRELIDFFLDRKTHHQQLDDDEARERPGARHVRLHPGDDRAPASTRRCWWRSATAARQMNVRRHPRGQAHRGARLQAARRLHRVRPRVGRDPRGRSRHGRVLPRQGPAARGALDHQAAAVARTARARRRGGALHAHADRDRGRRSRSRSAGWSPRRSSSARAGRVPRPTSSRRPRSPRRWSGSFGMARVARSPTTRSPRARSAPRTSSARSSPTPGQGAGRGDPHRADASGSPRCSRRTATS